jgi:hypothetical protein
MRTYSDQELADMTMEHATTAICNAIYETALFYERLEGAGKITGNGHHMAQELASVAAAMLRDRWIAPEPEKSKGRT